MLKRFNAINWKALLGEFAVVLLSILLAFAVNRWGEQHKDRQSAIQYLQNLKEELHDDVTELQRLSKMVSESQRSAGTLAAHAAQVMAGRDTVALLFFGLLRKHYDFYPHNATYESIKFSGDLKLLNNLELKRQIVEHYSQYQRIDQVLMQYNHLEKEYVAKYLMDNLDYSQFGKTMEFNLLEDRYMKNIIYSHLGIYASLKQNFDTAAARCNDLIKLIDAELKRL